MLTEKQLKNYFKKLPHSFALFLFTKDSIKKDGKFLFRSIIHKKDFQKIGIKSKSPNWKLRQEFEYACQDLIDSYFYQK